MGTETLKACYKAQALAERESKGKACLEA